MEKIILKAFDQNYTLLEEYFYKSKLGLNPTPKQHSLREKRIKKKMINLLNKPQVTQVECERGEL